MLAAFLSLASSVHADDSTPRRALLVLDSMVASAEPVAAGAKATLPTSLSLWTTAEDELDLQEAREISFADFFPQGRLSQKPPFIDFHHFEMGGFIGVVDFSSAFKANTTYVAGISARVPVPGIPGDWGIFGEAFLSYISRNLPFYYNNRSGNWIGAEVGGDYTFIRDDIWYFRAQAGILYAYWNHVNALDNGFGVLGGVQVGFYWIKQNHNAVVTLTPQLTYDGKNWMAFFTVGFSVDF